MAFGRQEHRIPTAWWPLVLVAIIGAGIFATSAAYSGTFRSYVPVTLASDRSGLVMETGAKVKLRGVDVGQVAQIEHGLGRAALRLEIDPDQIRYIPANVGAKIDVTTAFGAKYVELQYPEHPSPKRLAAHAVLQSSNVTTEVNTVFENVVDLLKMVEPEKLNAVLTAVAEGVRGRGQRIGEATTGLNEVLVALNARSETIRQDWRSLNDFNETYAAAADNIVAVLDAATTTSATVVKHKDALDGLLLSTLGFSEAGTTLLGASKDSFVATANLLGPTTDLLLEYNPELTCTLQGADWFRQNGAWVWGGDGRTIQLDVQLLGGNEPYIYPDNLPIVAAKGGPGGKPGCGSLPDVTQNFPVRQLLTNTGWGTGLDVRPNPGLGQHCYVDYFRVTRAVPLPPAARECLPGPAVGPQPELGFGTPPYGTGLYGPGGVPLFPGVPPAEPGPAPVEPQSATTSPESGDHP
ncbi:MCE family protein [[Mycobacterium] nativiensis]|uniref:MCE family protein n=1 Tax=[Mycobacterium] nativiensis TaxID=2855503 RepID=A0ABU5XQT0_9MYCO|nr:MCE family protein [Mycolicibacter sp. MYC340]MEB3030053.1 MCE family protein [Mycolicibacter sp. MYC340]